MSDLVMVFAPAKVNLHLAIGEKRPDGYHGARSVMHALSLHDTVTVRRESLGVEAPVSLNVRCAVHEGIEPLEIASEDNIAHKALALLAEEFGVGWGEHLDVLIDKHIPHAAGLGGGSSDAAAAMVAGCRLWGIDPADRKVSSVASRIGADVPFFLHGGCSVFGNRGDAFERALEPMKGSLVLVRPEAGVSTAAAYRAFDEAPCGVSAEASSQADSATTAEELSLFNNLAPASERVLPELARIRSWLCEQRGVMRDAANGTPRVLLSGSGSATFCLCDSMDAAYAVVSAAKREGWWARSCTFISAGARIMERGSSIRGTNLGAVHRIW